MDQALHGLKALKIQKYALCRLIRPTNIYLLLGGLQ